jgi:hypothetical protein
MKTPATPLFVKTHDFNVWLIQRTQRFPKNLRHSYTNRIEQLAFEFEELLLMANGAAGAKRLEFLECADAKLVVMRCFLRYSLDFQILSSQQVVYASNCLDELGRLLGAWVKGTKR